MNKRSVRLSLIVAWFVLVAAALFAAAVPVTPLWAGLTNNSGQPLSPGRVYFYVPGTTTAKNVWDEAAKTTPRAYVDLDGYGRAQVYGDGIYKLTVCDRTTGSDVVLYSIDNLEVQTATTSTSISPTTATIASATITTLTANGGTINSTTINSPTIVGGTANGTTLANGTISSSTLTTSTLTSPSISGGGFTGTQTGMSINSPTIVSPVITGTGTAVLASATITTLTVTTLVGGGLTWSGIGLSGVSITGASTINGATLDGCAINNPTFGGTTGAGTLKNLTLLEGPTSSYSGLAVAKTYVDAYQQAPVATAFSGSLAGYTTMSGSAERITYLALYNPSATNSASYLVWTRNLYLELESGANAYAWMYLASTDACASNSTSIYDIAYASHGTASSSLQIPVKLNATVTIPAGGGVSIYLNAHGSGANAIARYDGSGIWGYARVY